VALPKVNCPRCNDTGEQRYWEGRWRDEKAENEKLLARLKQIADLADGSPPDKRLGEQGDRGPTLRSPHEM